MESNLEGREKYEELEMMLKKWLFADVDTDDMINYRRKYDKEWFDREAMCYALKEDVLEGIDSYNLEFKLYLWFIQDFCLSSALNVQNALKRSIDYMQKQLNLTPRRWDVHGKACRVIEQVFRSCKDRYESHDSSSQQVYAQILDYLMKLIELCKDEKKIGGILRVLIYFPFNKHQSTFLKLIDSVGNLSNTDKCGWQRNLCDIIENVLNNTKGLNQQTCDRLFDYLKGIIDCCEDDKTIGRAWLALTQFPKNQIASQVYQPLIQNYLQSSQLNWRIHRNWLRLLLESWRENSDIFKENAMKMWFEYLRNVLHKCDHVELVSLAIRLVEVLCLREYFDVESEDVLKSELMGRVQSLDSECPLASDLPDEFDFDRYQVEWCARWCVHNVMDRHKRKKMGGELPLVKLSNDRFEARYDQIDCGPIPVRSQYSITSGVYFYETTIVTNGWMMFGWSTRDAHLDSFIKSGKLICHKNGDYIFVNLSDCHAGDVIGCLIDVDKRKLVFYCNGKEVMSVDGVSENEEDNYENKRQIQNFFSSSPFHATVFLFFQQHFYMKFGQASFKYAPNHIQFMDFHKASGKDGRKDGLSETGKIGCNFWFKHLPVDNQVDLFYRDKRQNECDELVKRVERDIEEGREVEKIKMELGCDRYIQDIFDMISMERKKWKIDIGDGRQVEEMKKKFECTRYIQAVIEEMGNGQGGDKVDVMAQWMWWVIKETIEDTRMIFNGNNKLKLLELLYPYLHLRINSTLITKHRNICIVLSNLIKFSEQYDYDYIKHIRKEVFTYLTLTLTETNDMWTQLFGLIALENMRLSDHEKKIIRENTKFIEILNKEDPFKSNNILSHSPLSYQVHFSIEHLFTQVHSPHPPRPNPTALNSHDRTSHLKLSLDLFSARSDWTWQSVRSTGRVTKGIYYFEAVLLTNGPMRIGWSTKRTEIVRTEVGGDQFSVAFDGYSQTVWHNREKLKIQTSLERWKARDVVGCLIRVTRNRENNEKVKHFIFFLNGQLLSYQAQSPIYSSPHPYHASISLSAHQQVFFNFGQVQFQHPPNVDYLTFTHYPQDVTNQKSPINLVNSNFTNAVVSIESTNTFGNFSMGYTNYTTSPSSDNILNSWITCQRCHKSILLKRIQFDCCACLKWSMKAPSGNQSQLAITSSNDSSNQNPSSVESSSTSVHKHSNKQKLDAHPASFTNNSTEPIKVEDGELVENTTDFQSPLTCEITIEPNLQPQNVMLLEENVGCIQCKQRIVVLEEEIKTFKTKFDKIRAFFNNTI